jgi:hypothetical protein
MYRHTVARSTPNSVAASFTEICTSSSDLMTPTIATLFQVYHATPVAKPPRMR